MNNECRWGIVATIKAPARDILRFAAHHLEIGAHRILIYLDAPCPDARPLLKAHPRIRVMDCDDASWRQRRKQGKPDKHQIRQTMNATRAYRRQTKDIDWLTHIDCDEFLWSEAAISDALAALPDNILCARIRPIESLAGGDGKTFKGFTPNGPERPKISRRICPDFGEYLKGGFVSHRQGKIFVRVGLPDISLRIHNAYMGVGDAKVENPGETELPEMDLCHFHATDWENWLSHYRYRLTEGSYRSELRPVRSREKGGSNLHELLSELEADQGEAGLRAFYNDTCADTPELRARLKAEGLLRIRDLQLDAKLAKHFPDFR